MKLNLDPVEFAEFCGGRGLHVTILETDQTIAARIEFNSPEELRSMMAEFLKSKVKAKEQE